MNSGSGAHASGVFCVKHTIALTLTLAPAWAACRCDALAAVGKTVANSEAQLRACEFLLSRQCADGGWGESYLSCQNKARTCACMLAPGPPCSPNLDC